MTKGIVILALMIIGLAGCKAFRDSRMERSVARLRATALSKIDVAKCHAGGGTVKGVGLFGVPACVMPYADAGKSCRSKTDCAGACVAQEGAALGAKAMGSCQADTAAMFGCHNIVKNGVVVAGMCIH